MTNTIKTWKERKGLMNSEPFRAFIGIEWEMQAEIDELRAALAQQAEQGWQDIETAPKSNPMKPEHRLIFWLDGVGPAFGYVYDDGAGGLLAVITGYSDGRWEPTHWKAMPAAPQGGV